MRLRTVSEIAISDCTAVNVLRGFRLQDISRGRVSDCSAISCLESGFYCAAGSYSGASGCTNMVISGCYVQDCLNNSYLVIGGSNVVITACSAQNVANSAVMAWHTQDLKVLGCTFNRATRLTWNGVGNDGDSFGALYHWRVHSNRERIYPLWPRPRRRYLHLLHWGPARQHAIVVALNY